MTDFFFQIQLYLFKVQNFTLQTETPFVENQKKVQKRQEKCR